MPVQAQSADGVIHEFPDGTKPEVIDKVMKAYAQEHTAPKAKSSEAPDKKAPYTVGGMVAHDVGADPRAHDRSLSNINPATAYSSDYQDRVNRVTGSIKERASKEQLYAQEMQRQYDALKQQYGPVPARKMGLTKYSEWQKAARKVALKAAGSSEAESDLAIPGYVGDAISGVLSPVTAAVDTAVGRPIEYVTGAKVKRSVAGDAAEAFIPIGGEVKAATAPEKALAASLRNSGKSAAEVTSAISRMRSAQVVEPITAWSGKLKQGKDYTPAQQMVLKRIAQTHNVTAQDMLDLAHRTPDKPLTLMDVGGPKVKGLAGKVVRTPEGGAELENFLRQRTRGQTERLDKDVSRDVAEGSAHETIEALKQSRKKAAEPLYHQAYEANPIVRSTVVDEIVRSRVGRDAWSKAIKDAQTEAGMTGARQSDKYSLHVLDLTKQHLDDVISAAIKRGDMNEARIVGGLKDRLLEELDAADKTGSYAKARAAWSGPTQSAAAVEFGRRTITANMSAPEIAAALKKMSLGDREFARIGFADALRGIYWKVGRNANSARAIADNPAFEARILPLFESKAKYQRFVDSVLAEDTMFRTDAEVTRGSQTAARHAEDQTHPAVEHAENALSVVSKLKAGKPLAAGLRAAEIVGDQATKLSPDQVRELTDILTSPISDANSAGARLLRDYHAVAPGTQGYRNFLAQARRRAVSGGAAASQPPQP